MSERLIKFGEPRFHPSRWANLRVQTLHYFRKMELGDRADGDEGRFEYEVNFSEPTLVHQDFFNSLIGGRIHLLSGARPIFSPPGSLELYTQDLSMRNSSVVDHFELVGSFRICFNTLNGFVFCMSFGELGMTSPFANSEALWSVDTKSTEEFSMRLAEELAKRVRQSDFHPVAVKGTDVPSLRLENIVRVSREVTYRDRKISISKKSEVDIRDLGSIIENTPFIKPSSCQVDGVTKSYQDEREYRFCFEFEVGSRIIPVQETYIDIPYSCFSDLIVPV